MRIRGVGFNYVNATPDLERRRKLIGCDRVIDAGYGEPRLLARLFKRYRDECLRNPRG